MWPKRFCCETSDVYLSRTHKLLKRFRRFWPGRVDSKRRHVGRELQKWLKMRPKFSIDATCQSLSLNITGRWFNVKILPIRDILTEELNKQKCCAGRLEPRALNENRPEFAMRLFKNFLKRPKISWNQLLRITTKHCDSNMIRTSSKNAEWK